MSRLPLPTRDRGSRRPPALSRHPKRPVARARRWVRSAVIVSVALLLQAGPTAAQDAVRVESTYWATRSGVSARVLLMTPPNPIGAVFLVPGGHGNINLDVQAHIGWGEDDFVIRTRSYYVRAGFIVVIPDVAIDVKPPASLASYRTSNAQAQDFKALIEHLKTLTRDVWMIAYDRGAISAFNAIGKVPGLPVSGLVLISPRFDAPSSGADAFSASARRVLAEMPVLLVSHPHDECSNDTVAQLETIAAQKAQATAFKAITVSGDEADTRQHDPWEYANDPCNQKADHTLAGEDASVSKTVIEWLLATRGPPSQ